MLKPLLFSSVLLLFMGPVEAREKCETLEASELKAMSVEKLKLDYCLNAINIDSQKGRGDRALKMSGVELQNPMGADHQRISQLRQEEADAIQLASRCQKQNTRILDALGHKKADKLAIMKECPSR